MKGSIILQGMENTLVAVRSTTTAEEFFISETPDPSRSTNLNPTRRATASNQHLSGVPLPIDSAEHATEILRSKPNFEQLVHVLQFLDWETSNIHTFDVRIPTAQAAQIVTVLISDTLPAYWSILNEESHQKTSKKS